MTAKRNATGANRGEDEQQQTQRHSSFLDRVAQFDTALAALVVMIVVAFILSIGGFR